MTPVPIVFVRFGELLREKRGGLVMMRVAVAIGLGVLLFLAGCSGASTAPASSERADRWEAAASGAVALEGQAEASASSASASVGQGARDEGAKKIKLSIDGVDVGVKWEDNQAVADLVGLVSEGPLTVGLSMYGGFEQVGSLGASLTARDEQMTAAPGDIVLYAGNQISIFYGSNSWAYTRLGHITDKSADEMAQLLGNGDVSITISLA